MSDTPANEDLVGFIPDSRLRVEVPYRVVYGHCDGHVHARAPDFDATGEGLDRAEALRDLQDDVVEMFFALRCIPDDEIGPWPRSVRDVMRNHFSVREGI